MSTSQAITTHNPQFSTAGQLQASDMAVLAQQGYKTVINNRPDFEGGPDQPSSASIQAAAQAAGLAYHHLPVIPGQVTAEQVQAMAAVLHAAQTPILAFCRSGARSTNLAQLALSQG